MNFFKNIFNSQKPEQQKNESKKTELSLDDLFVQSFVNKGGKFLYCETKEEIKENLKKIFKENDWSSVFTLSKELKPYFSDTKIDVLNTDTLNSPFLTTCEHLISESADIMFSSNQLGSKKLNTFPDNFIVIATTSQIVKNTGQGLTGIKVNCKGSLPTNISSIKNYKIIKNDDNFLNYGNSNSKNLYLLLLENL
jgi:L-lactate utilization protein LutC